MTTPLTPAQAARQLHRDRGGRYAPIPHPEGVLEIPGRVDPGEVVLVYRDEAGTLHEQPIADVLEAGTLIDEDGDDLTFVEVRHRGRPMRDLEIVYLDADGMEYRQPAADIAHVGGLVDEDGDDLEFDHLTLP